MKVSNIVVFCCLVLLISTVNCRIVFEEKFLLSKPFDPTSNTSLWNWYIPGALTQKNRQIEIKVDPVQRVIDPPFPFGINHVTLAAWGPKYLPYISIAPNETLRVTVKAAFRRTGVRNHPFGSLVSNPTDDPRLGTCGFLIQHPESQTTACAFHSNNYIWNWHDRFSYPSASNFDFETGTIRPAPYKGFISWKRGGQTCLSGFDKIVIEYDRLRQEFRWYLNGVLTRRSLNPGGYPQRDGNDVTLFAHAPNASTSKVDLNMMTLTFACVNEPDKIDPFNTASKKGLYNHNQPDSLYTLPETWFSSNDNSANDLALQAFGQSMSYKLKSVKVELI
jgi:hypothetical protein